MLVSGRVQSPKMKEMDILKIKVHSLKLTVRHFAPEKWWVSNNRNLGVPYFQVENVSFQGV